MADSAEESKTDNSQLDESSEATGPEEIAQSEINELLTNDEENIAVLAEGQVDVMDLEEDEENKSVENENTNAETKEDEVEMEADEYLDMTGENAFEADVLDLAGGDDVDDDGKENHEGDGENEEMKDEEEEEEEEEDPDDAYAQSNQDPNVMPQVNVAVLAQRKWQVKVYPLKPSDFVNGQISRVFKHARESLLYLLSPGRNARGKGEMYVSSVNQAVRCVHSLMRLEYFHPEINIEIIKKNDEGVVEEKAYLRFDSKLTQVLTSRTYRRGPGGRKRDRLIGSVFVKNLPAGTTKDTLRVMFPFAQEINYNPEKFKDCTARLVLHYRTHVIPCLKAFAKAELGGNVLELHPLTKRKRGRNDDDKEVPDAKLKKTEEPKKEETSKKSEDCKAETPKQSSGEKKAPAKKELGKESKEKSESKSADDSDKKESKDKKDIKPSQNRRNRKPANRIGGQRKPQDQKNEKPNRPILVDGKERSGPPYGGSRGGGQSGKSPLRSSKGRQDRPSTSSPRSYRDDRNREFRTAARRFGNNRNNRPRGSSTGSGSRQSQGNFGRSSYGISSGLGLGSTMTASDANLAINAEATKEMVLLQNQLSMAIKNQLTMLNQTQMAVEQAKRGASSIGLGSDLQSSLPSRQSPKASLGGSRRSLDQYRPATSLDDNLDRYDNRPRQRSKGQRRGGGGGSGAGASGIGSYKRGALGIGGYRDEMEDWDRELSSSQFNDPYTQPQDFVYEREHTSFGSQGRSSSYNMSSGYSGYY